MLSDIKILIVASEKEQVSPLREYLNEHGYFSTVAYDKDSVLDALAEDNYQAIFSTVTLKHNDSFDLYNTLKERNFTNTIHFVFILNMPDEENLASAFSLGGLHYIPSDFTPKEINPILENIRHKKEGSTETDYKQEVEDLTTAFVIALEKANYYNDDDTGNHIKRVKEYSRVLAKGLKLEPTVVDKIYQYASLHDIGKVGVPGEILKKPARLTEEEYHTIKEHPYIGYKMIAETKISDIAKNIVYCHHEKYNGTGYPQGLYKEEIPVEAKIVALADVYDALTTERVYKEPYSLSEADEIIRSESGKHFDPKVVEVYTKFRNTFAEIRNKYRD